MHQYLTVYKQHYIDLYLVPWVCFNLWEFELRIIGVHAFNFFPCRGTKDLQQMIKFYVIRTFAWEIKKIADC